MVRHVAQGRAHRHGAAYYLGAGGTLSTGPASGGTGKLSWAPATAANSLTYTSAPLTRDAVIDGPSDLTVYASSTTTEVELTATLNVLAPAGAVVKQADGVLLGSQRKLDQGQSPTPQELAGLANGTYTIGQRGGDRLRA
jgi:predicted acyl esterase